MRTSWTEKGRSYKSSWPVVASFLLRSREYHASRCRCMRDEINQLKREVNSQRKLISKQTAEIKELRRESEKLQMQITGPSSANLILPPDPPVGSHGYGTRMISLAVDLARDVGLRGAARCIEKFLAWLDVNQRYAPGCSDLELPNWNGPSSVRRIGFGWLIIPIRLVLKKR